MDKLWQIFYSSGKIADYLIYKHKLIQGGNKNADSERSCDKRAPIRR